MSRYLLAALGVLGLALLVLASASAEARGGGGVCREEIAALCPGLERGPDLRACIKDKRDQLSPECQQKMAHRAHKKQMRAACHDDVAALCSDVERERGAIKRCLREHEADLSDACRAALPNRGDDT